MCRCPGVELMNCKCGHLKSQHLPLMNFISDCEKNIGKSSQCLVCSCREFETQELTKMRRIRG